MYFLLILKFRLKFNWFYYNSLKIVSLVALLNAPFLSIGQDQKKADSLISIERRSLPDSVQLSILRDIAFYHTNPDIMLLYSDSVLSLAREVNDLLYMSKGHYQKGNAYRLKGSLSKASENYFKSAKISEKLDFQVGLAAAYLALGDVYSLNNDHQNSRTYYYKAIGLYGKANDSINLASALLNLGDEYYNVDKLDSAVLFFNQSHSIFNALNYRIGQGYCLGNLGLVYASQNKSELAEQHLQEAIEILTEVGDFYPIAVYLTYMADIYWEKRELELALNYAHQSLTISEERGYKEQIRDANLKLAELYGALRQFESAFLYQSQYILYRDSVHNEQTTQKIANLRTEYEIAKKQSEIDLLTEKDKRSKIRAVSLGSVVILVGALAYVLFRNNRRKKLINEKLLKQQEVLKSHRDQLQSLNQTKDRFFSIISHDLRGPVNAFNGISNLIKYYIKNDDMKNLVEVTEYIDKSASQLSTLLDNLLDWAVSQQGSFPYNPERLLLNTIIQEIVEIFQTTAHAKRITMEVAVSSEIYIWADRNSMTTILRNLVNNALKFTNPEGSVVIAAVEISREVAIDVIDTGIGISEDKLERIFALSNQKNTNGTAGERGLGLGLQLAYDFTEMNNGSISVKLNEDVGTTFTVKIPLYHPELDGGTSAAKLELVSASQ